MSSFAGFMTFVRVTMGIPTLALPDGDPAIQNSYDQAVPWVNTALQITGFYDAAVYNLAGDFLLNNAVDQPERTYFAKIRKDLGLDVFVSGVTGSFSDSSTSKSTVNPEFMKTFTFGDLQRLKSPYGRQYLDYAQSFGTGWGIS